MPGRQYGLHFAGPFCPARSRSDPESAPVKISGRRLCLQHAEHPGASGLPPALSLALTSVVPGSTHRPNSDRRPGCGAHTPRGVYGSHWPDHRPRLQRWSATWRCFAWHTSRSLRARGHGLPQSAMPAPVGPGRRPRVQITCARRRGFTTLRPVRGPVAPARQPPRPTAPIGATAGRSPEARRHLVRYQPGHARG
jgi:hypothetical protein